MPLQYLLAQDKLRAAVLLLVLESSPLQKRLARAYLEALHNVGAGDVPVELRVRLLSIHGAMTAGNLKATEEQLTLVERQMDDARARHIAAEIVDLFVAIMHVTG